MRLLFREERSVGKLNGEGSVQAEASAYYDKEQHVLCVDLIAAHFTSCEDDGSPRGCRFCAPSFPAERRVLETVRSEPLAIRRAIQAADEWFAEAGVAVAKLQARGPLEVPAFQPATTEASGA